MVEKSWNEHGCQICRAGWMCGRSPRLLRVDRAGHCTWYRCDECGEFWMETERYAAPVHRDEVVKQCGEEILHV